MEGIQYPSYCHCSARGFLQPGGRIEVEQVEGGKEDAAGHSVL